MHIVIQFVKTYKHFFLQLIFLALGLWFGYLEETVVPRFWVETPLDVAIPFVPVFVVPYLLWFLYVAGGILFFGFHEKQSYFRLCAFLFTGMAITCLLYTLFPHGQPLRPNLAGQHGVFVDLVRYIYMTDTPTNCCPSLHVLNALAVHDAVAHSAYFRRRPEFVKASSLLCVLICASTVLIKQHSILDVACALALGLLLHIVIYRPLSQEEPMHRDMGA